MAGSYLSCSSGRPAASILAPREPSGLGPGRPSEMGIFQVYYSGIRQLRVATRNEMHSEYFSLKCATIPNRNQSRTANKGSRSSVVDSSAFSIILQAARGEGSSDSDCGKLQQNKCKQTERSTENIKKKEKHARGAG